MRMTCCLLVIGGLYWASAGAHARSGPWAPQDDRRALVVSLDVPEDRAPDWLCVLTHESCEPGSDCRARSLDIIAPYLDPHQEKRYFFTDEPSPLPRDAPPDLTSALSALMRRPPPQAVCSHEDYGACIPELDLEQFGRTPPAPVAPDHRGGVRRADARPVEPHGHVVPDRASGSGIVDAEPPRLSGQITCGMKVGTEVPASSGAGDASGSFAGRRVAFVALSFSNATYRRPGIKEIKFLGTTATLHFEAPLPPTTATSVQVIGGDYVASPSSALGNDESVIVKLQPRCNRFVAEIPAHDLAVETVSLDSPSLRKIAKHAARRARHPSTTGPAGELASPDHGVTCIESAASRTIALELPVTPASEDKRLTVRSRLQPLAATSEVRWTESLPPTPLKLGVRSIQFRWRRPIGCLAERWREPPPASPVTTWTQSCPQARLANSTTCSVISPEPPAGAPALTACEYRCVIDDKLSAPMLPIAVTFERIRANSQDRPEIVYSWGDRLEFSGQELTSVVAPSDRRVMLELPSPSNWKDRAGDQIDAIQVLVGSSGSQLYLAGRGAPEVPPPWSSLPTVGRTCTDGVRVAILGTRRYDETTFDARDGHVELTRPYDYRMHLRFYVLLGTGSTFRYLRDNLRSATFGDVGLGGQYDLGGPWSLDVEATGQLTHTFYGGVQLPEQQRSEYLAISYLRFDAHTSLEGWYTRRFGAALGVGLGFGTPVSFVDSHIVGDVQLSTLVELQPLIFTMFPRQLWLIAGAGTRLFEQHRNYATDFTGSPTPLFERDPQGYLFLRLRGVLE